MEGLVVRAVALPSKQELSCCGSHRHCLLAWALSNMTISGPAGTLETHKSRPLRELLWDRNVRRNRSLGWVVTADDSLRLAG